MSLAARALLLLALVACEKRDAQPAPPIAPPAPAVAPRPEPPGIGFITALRKADGFVRISVATVKRDGAGVAIDGRVEAVFKGTLEVGSQLRAVYVEHESPILLNGGRAKAEFLERYYTDKHAKRLDLYLLVHATTPCCRVDIVSQERLDDVSRSRREAQDAGATRYVVIAAQPDEQAILDVVEIGLQSFLGNRDETKLDEPGSVCGDLMGFAAAGKTPDPKRLAEIMRAHRDRALGVGGSGLGGPSPSFAAWVVAFLDRDDQVEVAKRLLASYVQLRKQLDDFDERRARSSAETGAPMSREHLSWPHDRILESMEAILDADKIRKALCPGSPRRRTDDEVVAQIRTFVR